MGSIAWQSWLVIGPSSVLIMGMVCYTILQTLKRKDLKVSVGKNGVSVESENDNPITDEENGHKCVRVEYFKQFALVLESMADVISGLAAHAIANGANGPVMTANAKLDLRRQDLKAFLNSQHEEKSA